MAKYIRCSFCNGKIMFGQEAYHRDYCYVYCSIDCYFDDNGCTATVDENFANSCDSTVYDDDVRISEIQKEMEEHRVAIEKLYEELEVLTAQNEWR